MIPAERETTITYDDEQQIVRIFSARQTDQTKLRKAGILPTRGTQLCGFFYEIPLSAFKWRVVPLGKPRAKKILSPNHPFLRANRDRKGIPDGG